ncbi:AraC family transcriptional regulator [Chitinibacter fontanus]|uniref:AraC family transcriptional regulator n=1 Tax=Chitinibacter fontanus TaxID=1737446 RepID=A0A7D5V9A2_9NEIS|nr:helix-turn-helix domain-containing protein [Chitinibacter fontanus]QLI81477.1 AraC family transcriptional regulator [Chitinibacter fontanus]
MALIYYERFDCDDKGWNRLVGAHVFHKASHPPMREKGIFMCGVSEARGKSEIERIDANFHVLLFCLNGTGEFFEGEQTWPFKAGQMGVQPARGQRGFRRTGKAPLLMAWLLLYNDVRWAHLIQPHCYVRDSDAGWEIHDALSLYQREALRHNEGQSYTLVMPALEMLSLQLERAVGTADTRLGWPQQLHALFSEVAKAPEREWPVEQLAQQLQITPAHLHRLCLTHLGMAPGQHVVALRMQHARTLLMAGVPVGQVASQVGYQEVASFSRRFRQHFGLPPSQVRN